MLPGYIPQDQQVTDEDPVTPVIDLNPEGRFKLIWGGIMLYILGGGFFALISELAKPPLTKIVFKGIAISSMVIGGILIIIGTILVVCENKALKKRQEEFERQRQSRLKH